MRTFSFPTTPRTFSNDEFLPGRTVRTDAEFPDGVPCVIFDRDSVLCEFRGSYGERQAEALAALLNAVGWKVPRPTPVNQATGD